MRAQRGNQVGQRNIPNTLTARQGYRMNTRSIDMDCMPLPTMSMATAASGSYAPTVLPQTTLHIDFL